MRAIANLTRNMQCGAMHAHVYVRRGKFGTVRVGKCKRSGNVVAIKTIKKSAMDAKHLLGLLNEVAIMKKARAPLKN